MSADSQLLGWTGARQTMSSWARPIELFEEVPDAFKEACRPILDKSPLPYAVFLPSMSGFPHRTAEKVICDSGDVLYIWERTGKRVTETQYAWKDISALEVGSILLFSWLTFSGVTREGASCDSTVEFNTAIGRHLTPFINKLRPSSEQVDAHIKNMERDKFNYLSQENFKFMNYGAASLCGTEKVLQTLWQPEVKEPYNVLWFTFQRTAHLSHLAILTDKEFILVGDDERSLEVRGSRHGGKSQYVALNHIQSVAVSEREDGLLSLSLTLKPGEGRLDVPFEASRSQEVARMCRELEGIISLN
jgi:hypothetical protein